LRIVRRRVFLRIFGRPVSIITALHDVDDVDVPY